MTKKKQFWLTFLVLVVFVAGYAIYRMFFAFDRFTLSSDNQILTGDNHTYKFVKVADQNHSTVDRFAFGKTQNGDDIFKVKEHPDEVILIVNTEMPPWFLYQQIK